MVQLKQPQAFVAPVGYTSAAAITTSDTVDFANGPADGIYVGGAGNIVWVAEDNTTVTLTAVPVGTILPIKARRINATSTTATLLIALYY